MQLARRSRIPRWSTLLASLCYFVLSGFEQLDTESHSRFEPAGSGQNHGHGALVKVSPILEKTPPDCVWFSGVLRLHVREAVHMAWICNNASSS